MPEVILSDYFYGAESEEFIYFKIPRLLITDSKFKHVSTDAKLLYGMLLDRMGRRTRARLYLLHRRRDMRGYVLRTGQGHEAAGRAGQEERDRFGGACQAGPGPPHQALCQAVHHPDSALKADPSGPG